MLQMLRKKQTLLIEKDNAYVDVGHCNPDCRSSVDTSVEKLVPECFCLQLFDLLYRERYDYDIALVSELSTFIFMRQFP